MAGFFFFLKIGICIEAEIWENERYISSTGKIVRLDPFITLMHACYSKILTLNTFM